MYEKLKRKTPWLVSIAVLLLAVYIKQQQYPVVEQISLQMFDLFQDHKPREYTPLPVAIIDIDEESLQKMGQWPWPRVLMAQLTDRLTAMGAAAIALDIVFSEEDRTSPESMISLWGQELSQEQAAMITGLPDHDLLFGEAIARSNVTTGFALIQRPSDISPARPAGISFAGHDPKAHLAQFMGAVTNIPAIEGRGAGNGALNIIPEYDGIVRRMPLFHVMNGKIYPTLTAEALRIAQGADGYLIKTSGASGETDFGINSGITAVKIGQFVIPTDAHGAFWIYYTGKQEARYIPAWQVFSPDFPKERVEGHILLIGSSATMLKDQRATPYDPSANGVEIHAQAIEQVLTGEYLLRPDWVTGMENIVLFVVGIILIIVMLTLPVFWGVAFTFTALAAVFLFSWRQFDLRMLLVDAINPGIAVVLLYFTGSLTHFMMSERKRRAIRDAFNHYMSPQMVDQLAKNPDKLKLGGEMKELTLLFCDIRGFTSIAERLDAEGLTRFLNRFLTPMTDIIMQHHGTIDKYIGDAIMAFWNAPLDDPHHAANACTSALKMLPELEAFNARMKEEAEAKGGKYFPVQIGIGMNTGVCCVGNMGSEQRFDYSVIGDDVNLASRLEGQTKTYGVAIIISEHTEKYIRHYATLEVDFIRVKGRRQAVCIYALLGDETLGQEAHFLTLKEGFGQMLKAYRAQNWAQALEYLHHCQRWYTQHLNGQFMLQGLFSLYEERILAYQAAPPPEHWDGVFIATAK